MEKTTIVTIRDYGDCCRVSNDKGRSWIISAPRDSTVDAAISQVAAMMLTATINHLLTNTDTITFELKIKDVAPSGAAG